MLATACRFGGPDRGQRQNVQSVYVAQSASGSPRRARNALMEGVCNDARSVGGLGRWSLECPAGCKVWLLIERATDRVLVTAWLATGSASPPHQVCPPWHTN